MHHIDIREDTIVDTGIVDSPHRPDGKLRIEVSGRPGGTRTQEEKYSEELYQHTAGRQRKGVELPKRTRVLADRGYPSSENRKFLSESKLKNGIMYKRNKGEAGLNPSKQLFNRIVSQYRYAIDRSFGGIRRWFHGGVARYYGLKKAHTQNATEAIAYNLYVTPGIIMRNSLKNA